MPTPEQLSEKWATICNQAVSNQPEHPPDVAMLCVHCAEKAIAEAIRTERVRTREEAIWIAHTHLERVLRPMTEPGKSHLLGCCCDEEIESELRRLTALEFPTE